MYSVDAISKLLGLHPKTVRRHIREGRIAATKIGREYRVTRDALAAFTHGELARPPAPEPALPLADRILVSASIEIADGFGADVDRLTNQLLAMLSAKLPEWGPARMDTLTDTGAGKLRIVLHGRPAFLSAALSAIDVFVENTP